MKVSGFSFIRNAIKYDYPIVEAIRSIMPICDEFVVAVGDSEDETLELIRSIAPGKIKIIETTWDDSLREGGKVLAVETDKAYQAISEDCDWAFYIQGDEVVHEKYLEEIRNAMLRHKDEKDLDGLILKYLHFYGSYDYVGDSSQWYHREIRIIRKRPDIYSYNDAQGFRKGDNQKLSARLIDAYMYHYGWVKDPRAMQLKQEDFNKLWHDDEWVKENIVSGEEFDYEGHVKELKPFTTDHPEVMKDRIARINWAFDHDISVNRLSIKDKMKNFLTERFGMDLGRKNYKLVK